MATRIKAGHFEPDGAIIYLNIGFVPDFFLMAEMGATNPPIYIWWERQEDDEASGSQEGISIVGGSSNFTKLADAGGITAYDSSSMQSISDWAANTAYTGRTATAHGSYAKGTTSGTDVDGSPVDREAIFECVTAGTSGSSEPTWPVETGQNSASDNGVIWQKVSDVALGRTGYQGVTIAAALMTDGQEMYYLALGADSVEDHGDVVGWTGGVQGA